MLENLNKYQIVLASNSPRRKELLQRLGVPFKVRTLLGVDESYPDSLKGEDISRYIARNKAEAYRSSMAPNELLIAADTIVSVDGEVWESLVMLKMQNACCICFLIEFIR